MKLQNKAIVGFFRKIWEFNVFFWGYFSYVVKNIILIVRVIFDVFKDQVDLVKDWFVKRLFWGRGENYRFFSQASLVGIVIFLIVVASYNVPVNTPVYSYNDYVSYSGVAQNDILVFNGTVETLVPSERMDLEMRQYTVKKGDSLSSISQQFGVNTDTIKWANNLTSSNYIKEGMVLKIPPGDGLVYTVTGGDTVHTIAKKYNIPAQSVADMNYLDRNLTLTVGQEIFLPDAEMPKPVVTKPVTSTASIPKSSVPADPNAAKFLSWPVANTSGTMVSQCSSWHHIAFDIADRNSPQILAAYGGTVVFAGWGKSYGNYVQVEHPNGYHTVYAHLSSINVSSGQQVSTGSVLGVMGTTGRSTGIHLHFEVRTGSSWHDRKNPANYITIPSSVGGLNCK